MQQFGERLDVHALVDDDDAASRVGAAVDEGDAGREGMADYDRSLDFERCEQVVHERCDRRERCGVAAALTVRGQVDRDALHAVEPVDDRPPGSAVEGQPVQEDDGRP